MIAIICLDEGFGMTFGGKRQSQDRKVRQDILETSKSGRLLMNEYTFLQFEEKGENFLVCEDFLERAQENDFCLIENVEGWTEKAEKIIAYFWNREYPRDGSIDLKKAGFKEEKTETIVGFSHPEITKIIYIKEAGK